MKKVFQFSIAAMALLLVGLFAIQSVAAASSTVALNEDLLTARSQPIAIDDEITALKEAVPETFEEADDVASTTRHRFLLYTHDGVHVMWGVYGNGHFAGRDNHDVRTWGIYGKGVFAGFYGSEFFYGRYRDGQWNAVDLFGEANTHGSYVLFPGLTADVAPAW
jgi:hypothetical protein